MTLFIRMTEYAEHADEQIRPRNHRRLMKTRGPESSRGREDNEDDA